VREDVRHEIFELHANLCKGLADPKRLLIIEALRDKPRTVSEISAALELPQSNVSQHLGILRQREIVRARRLGSNVFYSLTNPKVLQALDLLREVMAEQLAERSELHRGARRATARAAG
jgi:ArsR family transcriptional regulator